MRERPILFSAPMVRALLAGTKTQTRRVVKGIDPANLDSTMTKAQWRQVNRDRPVSFGPTYFCPYGQPGDRLWVRESFWGCDAPGWGDQPCVVYDDEWHGKEYRPAEIRPWARKFGRIPSIHMPRDCSRITLEIIGVRVEHLQDISGADCWAEGIEECDGELDEVQICHLAKTMGRSFEDPQPTYAALWESINGAGSWQANPWVWVVEFRVSHPRTDGGGRG